MYKKFCFVFVIYFLHREINDFVDIRFSCITGKKTQSNIKTFEICLFEIMIFWNSVFLKQVTVRHKKWNKIPLIIQRVFLITWTPLKIHGVYFYFDKFELFYKFFFSPSKIRFQFIARFAGSVFSVPKLANQLFLSSLYFA